ncbi:hypothetical protein MKW94_007990 [Papaver nudicaule]|uniref:Shikimate O-hydroxycinnamoyltransferase n=1 Tax=Papaver nudicaule TaxID=74823 RepID=A0AA41RW59_PAPNU|nr:hypothetical protein [Papaver nudicaule]
MLKVRVRDSSVVKPKEETPKVFLWTSNIDQLYVKHVQAVYFYRRPALTSYSSSCSDDFFNSTILKDGLSKALVTHYPIAGRLKRNESGRAEIECTGEGVIFIEAETDSLIKDLGEFTPNEQLMPISFTSISHLVVDGVCGVNFFNAWSELCRGVDNTRPIPFFDRTVLRARDPPIVSFPHMEYKPPSMNIPPPLPFDSVHEVIAGHIWRCSCKARELKDDQETMISIPLDYRSRSRPPLPDGYFGNAIFHLTPTAISGDIVSKPLCYAVNLIHEIFMMSTNNEYFRSALDFLELHPNIYTLAKSTQTFNGCNIRNSSWVKLPLYEADFGWGPPLYVGPGVIGLAGRSFLTPNPPGSGGGFSLIISLESDYHMNLFREHFYDI